MSKPPAPSDLADKFMLRMPEGMRDRVREAADASGRSMNAEIVQRLEESFATKAPLGFNVNVLEDALEEMRAARRSIEERLDSSVVNLVKARLRDLHETGDDAALHEFMGELLRLPLDKYRRELSRQRKADRETSEPHPLQRSRRMLDLGENDRDE